MESFWNIPSSCFFDDALGKGLHFDSVQFSMSAIVKVSGQSLAEQARNASTGCSAAFQIDEFVTLFVVIGGGIEFENVHMHMYLHVYIVSMQHVYIYTYACESSQQYITYMMILIHIYLHVKLTKIHILYTHKTTSSMTRSQRPSDRWSTPFIGAPLPENPSNASAWRMGEIFSITTEVEGRLLGVDVFY